MQPPISLAQIDVDPLRVGQTHTVEAQTKTNTFQEVFINGQSFEIDSAENTTNPDRFTIADDFTDIFTTGTTFFVSGSAGNDGTYTVVENATFAAGFTTIYVTNGSITTNEGAGLGTGFINTGERLVLPNNSATLINVFLVGRDTVASPGEGAGFITRSAFVRDATAASVVRIGGLVDSFSRENMAGTPDVDLTADTTNGSIKLEIKGSTSGNVVVWSGVVLLQQIET